MRTVALAVLSVSVSAPRKPIIVAASMVSADFAYLAAEVGRVDAAGADWKRRITMEYFPT
jgi:uncharacterized membrane-anchored protein